MNVSILIPIYNADKTFDLALKSLKKQKFKGKIEIIQIEKGLGLAESLNYGIQKAKYDIIVSLHQDCIPFSEFWLANLIESLKKDDVVASVSKVELPISLWNSFDLLSKLLTAKEKGILTPLMDEKGCAYKKNALIKAGLFDFKTFRTCGEDFDMYFKLKKQGKIVYPACKVMHIHKTTLRKRLKKEYQYAEGYGTLFRRYKTRMPRWFLAILKTIPFLGMLIFILMIPRKPFRLLFLFPLWIFLSLLLNFIYSYGFWKGFIRKKQSI